MEENKQVPSSTVALVIGVIGMAGLSLAEALKSPNALGGPWMVHGASRRTKPSWFPPSIVDNYITFDATSYDDTLKNLSPISNQVTHIFWTAIQISEIEENNINVNSTMLANVINVLKSAPSSMLNHISLQTGTQYYLGPIHCSDQSNLVPHDPPFSEELARLSYPNFYYPLEDMVASHGPNITWSVHRPSIIIGASLRSFYNALLTLVVYAEICKYEGLKFRYPGTRYTWEHFCDMSDARVLAEQHIWAATTTHAKNNAFNCSNNDIFMWKSMWKVLCETLSLEFVPFDENDKFDVVSMMKEKTKVWDEIVEKFGLYKTKLEEITCFEALQVVLHFKFQHVCSMNKSKKFGFFGHADSLKSIEIWVKRLREMKIIP